MNDGGPLPIDRVRSLGLRLLDALDAVHRAGVVHRDVKPSNVYLCTDGRVVLTDFGIACMSGEDAKEPVGVFVGSPPYISPELLRGERPGPASDLFSLGATLFAAVEGTAPFDKGDVVATITAVIAGAAPSPVRAGPLRQVIAGLLAKDPARRLTARQARHMLAEIDGRPWIDSR